MATKWISPTWRMPEESNQSKFENYSLSFDGSSQYIDLGNVYDNILTSSNFTVSTWIYSTENTSYDNFFNKGTTVQFYLVSNKIQIYLAPSGIGVWPIESTATLSLNTWYNIVFTRSGNENKLYINGTLDNSVTSTGSISSSTGSLTIGAYNGGSSYFWQGNLTEYSIFDYALTDGTGGTENQIGDLYNSGTPINPMAISGNAPIAYYPLGGGSTGSASTLTVPNESVPSATVFNFNRSDSDYIDLNPGIMKDFTSDNVSISAWVKANAFNAYDYIYVDGHTSGNKSVALNYASVRGGLEFTVGNSSVARASGVSINTGEWYHIVCTYAAGGDLKFYLNGNTTPVATATFSGSLDLAGHTVSSIGRSNVHSGNYWDGEISNVQVWNAELGTSDVTTLYNNGVPYTGTQPEAANLKGWWKMNVDTSTWNGSAWSITDSSGEGNTGTSSGMTTANLVNSDLTRSIPYSSYSMDFEELSSQNIDIGSSTLFDSTSAFSFSTWCKLESYDNSFPAFIRLKTDQSTGFIMGFSNYDATYYGVWFGSSSNFLTAKTSGNISADLLGVWKHISLVYDGVDRTAISSYSLYIDGVVQSLVSAGSFGATPNTNVIGQGNTASTFWDGLLSNVSVFNTTLTEDQVLTIYNGGVPNSLSSLSPVSWWSLAGDSYYNGTNWICPDLGSSGNNGTSANMAGTELVGDGPGSTANGIATSMDIPANLKGNAPNSSKNAFSVNMNSADRLSGITNIPGADSDVLSFLSAASITNTTQQTAINNLVLGLKNYGIWDKMKIIYPFVGSTDTSHSYNLKDTTVAQITWSTGVTHTSDGAKGATSGTGYGDTGVTPSTLGLGRDDASMGVYTQEGWVINQQFPFGIYSGNTSFTFYKAGGTPGSLYVMINDALSGTNITAPNPLTGFHQASRTQSSELSYKHNATSITTITAASAANPSTTKNLWVLAANGYTNHGYAATTSLIYFGLGLTDSELGEMNTLITAYQTELGRQV